jgi:hypothetical protein
MSTLIAHLRVVPMKPETIKPKKERKNNESTGSFQKSGDLA